MKKKNVKEVIHISSVYGNKKNVILTFLTYSAYKKSSPSSTRAYSRGTYGCHCGFKGAGDINVGMRFGFKK